MPRRILLPFISRSGNPIDSPIVAGGIEKVAKNIYDLFPGEIIPVTITPAIRKNRRTKDAFYHAIGKYRPDFILTNDIDASFLSAQIDHLIPTIFIMHEPLCGDIRYMELYKNMHRFLAAGGQLYFVSDVQRRFFQKHIERVTGRPLPRTDGLFNSGFCSGDEQVSTTQQFDAVTVGRTDVMKNPFFVHKKLDGSNLKSCVITTGGSFQKNPAQQKYYNDNLHWKDPRFTYRGLPHEEAMSLMSKGSVFVSTMPTESWGITAMEALARGLPTILVTDATGEHASEAIAASPKHIRKVRKNISPSELARLISEMGRISLQERLEISNATKQKHSRENYKARLEEMFYRRISS